MTTAKLSALAAILALTATSAFGGECCNGGSAFGSGYGHAAPSYGGPSYGGQVYGGGHQFHGGHAYGGGHGLAYGGTAYGVGQQPGGYSGGLGNPYHYSDGNPDPGYGGNVYQNHFGPGFHRHSAAGHYRFPYYSYRRPWYHVGPPAYGADTNSPW